MERSERLTLEVGPWSASVMSIGVTIVFVLVVGMLAKSAWANNDRADDWQRRSVAAEELVDGLRVVIAERSQALNQRTRQVNVLASTLDSSRGALRDTKTSVGSLTRRQQQLAAEKARTETELRKLRAQQTALISTASALDACSEGLAAALAAARSNQKKALSKSTQSKVAKCGDARASARTYVEQDKATTQQGPGPG